MTDGSIAFPTLAQGRSDPISRIALQSETGDGKAGGEDEIGHLVEPINTASARFRRSPEGRGPPSG